MYEYDMSTLPRAGSFEVKRSARQVHPRSMLHEPGTEWLLLVAGAAPAETRVIDSVVSTDCSLIVSVWASKGK
jgi:hypothetical protein